MNSLTQPTNIFNYDVYTMLNLLQVNQMLGIQPTYDELIAFWDQFWTWSNEGPQAEVSPVDEYVAKGSTPSQSNGRRTRIGSLSFEEQVDSLSQSISIFAGPDEIIFKGNKKGKDRINASRKRSKYIGVCKNGPHWQALISINKKKTYIGTYETQELAAKAYDFYCMLMQSLKAKTNFSYTKSEVESMICSYLTEGKNENISV